jgi:hypothetical protein
MPRECQVGILESDGRGRSTSANAGSVEPVRIGRITGAFIGGILPDGRGLLDLNGNMIRSSATNGTEHDSGLLLRDQATRP